MGVVLRPSIRKRSRLGSKQLIMTNYSPLIPSHSKTNFNTDPSRGHVFSEQVMKRAVVKKRFETGGGLGRDVHRWNSHLKGVPESKRLSWLANKQSACRGLTISKERARMRRFEGGARTVRPLVVKVENSAIIP